MGLSGAIGDAWEILANVGSGYPGSCALKAPIQDGHVGTSGARYWWCCCFRTSGARYWWCCCCVPVVTTVVLEKLRILWWPVCNCVRASRTLRLITGSMVLAHANSSEVRDCSRSSSGTSRTRRSWANMSGGVRMPFPRVVSPLVEHVHWSCLGCFLRVHALLRTDLPGSCHASRRTQ
jgi:hypothetical protein